MANVIDAVVDFLKSVESVELKAYLDNRGIITIGIGLAKTYLDGKLIKLGDTCTVEQAEYWLNQYLSKSVYPYVDYLKNKYLFNDGIYVALCSLIYNIGWHNLGQSIFKALEDKSLAELSSAFMLYCKIRDSKGEMTVSDGLVNRRQKEVDNFVNLDSFSQ